MTDTNGLQAFEQLKNLITAKRTLGLKRGSPIPPLSDLDIFLLGAVCKLFATGVTYPCQSLLLPFLPPRQDWAKRRQIDRIAQQI